jgi:hypothetical protein
MSIIYEALKKVEEENKPKTSEGINKSQYKHRLVYLFLGFIFLSLFTGYFFFFKKASIEKPLTYIKGKYELQKVKREKPRLPSHTEKYEEVSTKTNKRKYYLQGIIYTKEAPLALINGKRVSEGESINNAVVKKITPKGVKLETKEGKIYLPLE